MSTKNFEFQTTPNARLVNTSNLFRDIVLGSVLDHVYLEQLCTHLLPIPGRGGRALLVSSSQEHLVLGYHGIRRLLDPHLPDFLVPSRGISYIPNRLQLKATILGSTSRILLDREVCQKSLQMTHH